MSTFEIEQTKEFFRLARYCKAVALENGFPRSKFPEIRLEWASRFTSKMGTASIIHPNSAGSNWGLVRLSSKLFPIATYEKRRNTMIHEIAHIVSFYDCGKMGHGKNWKYWMRHFTGEEPKRCFSITKENLDVAAFKALKAKRKKQDRYGRNCQGCGEAVVITSNLRTRWIKRTQVRVHKCGTKLNHEFAIQMRVVSGI